MTRRDPATRVAAPLALVMVFCLSNTTLISAQPSDEAEVEAVQFEIETSDVYAQGRASIQMRKKCRDGLPRKDEDFEAALLNAKINAMRTWSARQSTAFTGLYTSSEQEILNEIDRYLLNPAQRYKCDKKTFTMAVTAQVNVEAIAGLLARKKPQTSGPRSRMTAVFVSRRQRLVKPFDDKVTKINESEEFSEAEQSAEISGSGMAASGYSSTRTVNTTGGSTERKKDEVVWEVFRADELDSAVNEIFTSFGFRVVEKSQLLRFEGFDLNAFREEFGTGDDLTPETKNSAFDAIAGKIPLLVIATVDVLGNQPNMRNDLFRTAVSVKAWVYKYDGLFYATVAAVAPTVEYGEAENETAAELNALINAAKLASTEIVNQLNAQGIQ